MRLSIVGTGYVGLVSGVCLANAGHQVVGVDQDAAKVEQILNGQAPFFEAGLAPLLARNLGTRYTVTTDLNRAVQETEATLIAVGTPFAHNQIDLRYIRQAAVQIGRAMRDKRSRHTVVVKSTVVPGTTDRLVGPLVAEASGRSVGWDFGLGVNPEFLSEGSAVEDFLHPDRIVLGGHDSQTLQLLDELYAPWGDTPRVTTNNATAEMIKYAANSLLGTLISFSNEIGNLCSTLGGIDVVDVMRGVHSSQYLSPRLPDGSRQTAPLAAFLAAGCGFGGSCLPKDLQALVEHGRQAGQSMPLLSAVLEINQQQPARMVQLLQRHFPDLRGVRVAVLGLAFKPGTDDMRLSPAIPIVRQLLVHEARVSAYDPIAVPQARRELDDPRITYCGGLDEALDEAQAVMLVTRWDEFRDLPARLAQRSPQPVCIDGRRLWERTALERYEGIGV